MEVARDAAHSAETVPGQKRDDGMTAMTCLACHKSVSDCSCPDIDERLHAIAYGPEMTEVIVKWCRHCDKHYARCHCETPAFFIISAGQDMTAESQEGFRNAAGEI